MRASRTTGVLECQLVQPSPGLGRPLWLFPGPGQDEGVGGPLRRSPGLLGGVPDIALVEPFNGRGLQGTGILEYLLNAVGLDSS